MSADPDEEKGGPQIVPDTARDGSADSAPPVERGPANHGAGTDTHAEDDPGTGTPDDR